MYEFHYKYIKTKYNAKLLFTDTVQFTKLKQMMFMKIFMRIKVCLILVMIHEIQSFFYLVSNKGNWQLLFSLLKDTKNYQIKMTQTNFDPRQSRLIHRLPLCLFVLFTLTSSPLYKIKKNQIILSLVPQYLYY